MSMTEIVSVASVLIALLGFIYVIFLNSETNKDIAYKLQKALDRILDFLKETKIRDELHASQGDRDHQILRSIELQIKDINTCVCAIENNVDKILKDKP